MVFLVDSPICRKKVPIGQGETVENVGEGKGNDCSS